MQQARTYRIVVNNNNEDVVEIDAEILAKFQTIKNMVDDFGQDEVIPPIPLNGDYTSDMLRMMVDFYRAQKALKENEKDQTLSMLVTRLSSMDDTEVSALARLANYLETSEFLNKIIDIIRKPLERMKNRRSQESLFSGDDEQHR